MADEIVGAADSAPVAETAPTEAAVETPDATHGDPAPETPETPTDAPDADGAPDPDEDDEESPPDQTDEEKTRSQQRRERRQKREAERIERAVTERFTRAEAERLAKETAEAAEATAKEAATAFFEEFGSFVGTPEARAAISKGIDDLISETLAINSDNDTATTDDLERLKKAQTAIAAKQAELKSFDRNAEVYQKLDRFQFLNTRQAFADRAATLSPEHRQAYLSATTVPEALERLETGLVAREKAQADARVAAVEAEWKGKLAREQAAHEATRTGAPGAGPAPHGANGTGGSAGTLTSERYRTMSFEERQALKSTPQGRAQIDTMVARQLAAR